MKKSESVVEIAKALATFQSEVKQPEKNADNPFFKSKYVNLESVVDTINKFGPKNGLSFTQWPSTNEQGKTGVATLLLHESGQWIEYDPIYMKSEKDTAQGAGSVISYLKRYSLSAVYGITSDEDDDGNAASGQQPKTQYQNKPKQQTTTNQPPAQTNGVKMITDPQIKAIGTKTGLIGKSTGVEQRQVYVSATKHLKIDKTTRELTAEEAGKVITYLSTLE